jgi:hypothetical protein
MTKEEFYARLKTFKEIGGVNWREGRNNAIWFMKQSDFYDNFGPPSQTRTSGEMIFWS